MSLLDIVSEKYEPSLRGALTAPTALSQLEAVRVAKAVRPKQSELREAGSAEPIVQSVDMLARELLRKRRSELQKQAADDWDEISADPGKLIAFASLEAIRQIRESGAIPDTYTAKTLCAGCQAEVPIFPGVPDEVDACPWCACGLTATPVPGVEVG